jgi:hypothetical protein
MYKVFHSVIHLVPMKDLIHIYSYHSYVFADEYNL